MLKRLTVCALLFCSAGAWAAAVPRYAQELNNYDASARSGQGTTRLRVTVAAAVAAPERSVRVGDLLLCSAAACYRARTPGYATVADTAAGKASVVADVMMPATTVTDVYFTDVSGGAVMQGHLKLETPLAIAGDVPAVELMLGVRRQQVGNQQFGNQQVGKQAAYAPVQSAHMVFADDSELVHYLPSVRTVAALSLGTTLTLPAGALERPQILNLGISKVGELFPKIDILPYVDLKKPGTIEVRALRPVGSAGVGGALPESIVAVDPAGRGDDLVAAPAERRLARLAFARTAVIAPSAWHSPSRMPCASTAGRARR